MKRVPFLFCAVYLACSFSTAHAGFINATGEGVVAPTKGAAAVSMNRAPMPEAALTEVGVFNGPTGSWGVDSVGGKDVQLSMALAQLSPINGVTFDADPILLSTVVSWGAGQDRRDALRELASTKFLNITFDDKVIRVRQRPVQFSVRLQDGNFRKVLKRWSSLNGWTFNDDHWKLSRDIPVSAEAPSLGSDFKYAVRGLMRASEMTKSPGRPCFYSNKVLRIVPVNEQCDRLKAQADN